MVILNQKIIVNCTIKLKITSSIPPIFKFKNSDDSLRKTREEATTIDTDVEVDIESFSE